MNQPNVSDISSATYAAVILVIFQFVTHGADAVNLNACSARLLKQQSEAQNTTNATGSPLVLSISYEQCLVECGSGMGNVNWQSFSENFGAWLLPWISLMFQIPFGAERKFQRHTFIPPLTMACFDEQSHRMMFFPFSSP